jgi:hypothetical protein
MYARKVIYHKKLELCAKSSNLLASFLNRVHIVKLFFLSLVLQYEMPEIPNFWPDLVGMMKTIGSCIYYIVKLGTK